MRFDNGFLKFESGGRGPSGGWKTGSEKMNLFCAETLGRSF